MSALVAYGNAAAGVVRRDFHIFASYRMMWLSQLLSGVFSLVLFYYLSRLVTIGEFSSPDKYYAFAVVGLLTLEILNSTLIFAPTAVRQELVAGTFERLVLSPFGAVWSIVSMTVFPLLWALVHSTLMIAIAALVFDLPVAMPQALLAIPIVFLGTLSFVPFGLIVCGIVLILKQALGAANWIVACISIVAGFYFPIALLPDWIQWVGDVQPFTPAIDLIRHAVVDTPLTESVWLSLLKLTGFALVLLPLSGLFIKKAIQISRRRGTIIEY